MKRMVGMAKAAGCWASTSLVIANLFACGGAHQADPSDGGATIDTDAAKGDETMVSQVARYDIAPGACGVAQTIEIATVDEQIDRGIPITRQAGGFALGPWLVGAD